MKGSITNEQLFTVLTEIKGDLKTFATKEDLDQAIGRLERKIDGNQKANIQHHLETKKAIGDLNKDLIVMREGLAHAAGF